MVEIYCGKLEDKSRLMIGAAVRAAMKEKNALLVSFKRNYSDYDGFFEKAPHVTLLNPPRTAVSEYFDSAVRMALTFKYTALILDGVFDMVNDGHLSSGQVYEFLSNAPDSLEIVCSGTKVDDRFIRIADEVIVMDLIDTKR